MAKKGIAIPYIIALILGIIVVGVIGYWFFTTTSTGGGSVTVTQCNAKKTQYCIEWSRTGFGTAPTTTWDTACTNVGVIQPTDSVCRTLTGLSSGATPSKLGQECTPGDNILGTRFCAPLVCDETTKKCK